MTLYTNTQAQQWVDKNEYPFESNYFETQNGQLHYIDEGEGDIMLFVHGTPTWSFLYRNYIKEFSKTHRCIALDHLGFGLSDKPQDFIGTPEAHAQNLCQLIEHLNLTNITLVVHDFGGPIGLSYAIANPNNVKKIVLFNTWLWSTAKDKVAQKIDKILHSPIGNFLYINTNFSPSVLFKKAFFDKKKLNKTIHNQYKKPFPNKRNRYGLLNIGKSLIGSSAWYQKQWKQINRIKHKPFLILWGEQDDFIKTNQLEKWQSVLLNQKTIRYQAGHFVQEEKPQESINEIKNWINELEH